eukprot:TRINITY_DN66156_c2_g3_i1.p1 TRINITY_DN66156_c2_g3~~TRINITY_DN66156_c2_g3_i1.p1  ORF type:complete len:1282 (+),score=733.03 TRINITY_DN66156_c2_g3_i1:3-3848(+)
MMMMMMIKVVVIAAVAVAACLSGAVAQDAGDVATCGGFVEASSTLAEVMSQQQKLDYSQVQMKLFTQDGRLKYSTECAPNGYYLIPVYDKGAFYLEIDGPDGWTFEPERVEFTMSATQNGCADDINFKFTGFDLTGRVTGTQLASCAAPQSGPAGVQLQLFSTQGSKNDNEVLATAVSDDQGAFTFNNVFPGNYRVVASHAQWSVQPAERAVTVEFGNSQVADPFVVQGYELSGSVQSFGEPVGDVDVFLSLLTDTDADQAALSGLKCSNNNGNDNVLCSTRSDKQGRFSFAGVPCGELALSTRYERKHTSFSLAPAEAVVSVQHGDTAMDAAFQVTGFSVRGRVVDRSKRGVQGATILVNSFEKTKTDADGYYTLQGLTSGKYLIKATKQHMVFHELKNFQVTPTIGTLPDITVIKYHLCGNVDSGENLPQRDREVVLTNAPSHKFDVRLTANTNDDGNYCFHVVPGKYVVKPTLTAHENSKGVLLSPPDREIEIADSPVLDVDFGRAIVSLRGRVTCIESPCDKSVKVRLVSSRRGSAGEQSLDQNDVFVFENVLPGEYKLTVQQDSWCWDQQTQDVSVRYEDVTDLQFVQSGFILKSKLSHDVTLFVRHSASSPKDEKSFQLERGTNRFCVAKAGVYKLRTESCYRFPKDTYEYDTTQPRIVELDATEFEVRGSLQVSQSSYNKNDKSGGKTGGDVDDSELEWPSKVQVQVKSVTNPGEVVQVEATRVDNDNDVDSQADGGKIVYTYRFWSRPGLEWEVHPVTVAEDKGVRGVLFYPLMRKVTVGANECPPAVDAFNGRSGLYLKGSVKPAVSGVRIVVRSAATGSELTVTTDIDGNYRAGPLYDDNDYSVSAVSEGYHFIEDGERSGHFRALKLGRVAVRVVHADAPNKPVQGVLLSLSGKGYRQNNATSAAGEFAFEELFPGHYFLRPLMKEYEFEPRQSSIEVEESSTAELTFKATRVAYSVFGSVHSLNGAAEDNVVIEASGVDADGHKRYEETVTDADGKFRLRGLVPGVEYDVQPKKQAVGASAQQQQQQQQQQHQQQQQQQGGSGAGSSLQATRQLAVVRSAPMSTKVTVKKQDAHGVHFVVFRELNAYDLTGLVDVSAPEFLSQLRVELCAASAPTRLLKVANLLRVGEKQAFFEFTRIPANDYVVRVRRSLSTATHDITSPSANVALYNHKHTRLSFAARLRSDAQSHQQSSPMRLVFMMAVVAIIINRAAVFAFVKRRILSRSSSFSSSSSSSSRRGGKKDSFGTSLAAPTVMPGARRRNKSSKRSNK